MPILWSILPYLACFLAGSVLGTALLVRLRRCKTPAAHRLLRAHFAPAPLATVTVTQREFPARVRIDLQRALEKMFQERATVKRLCGVKASEAVMMFVGMSLSEALRENSDAVLESLEYEEVDIGEEAPVRCLKNALWLLQYAGTKCAVMLSQVRQFQSPPKVRFGVATPSGSAAETFVREFFNTLEEAVKTARSYRGKVLSLESSEEYTGQATGIKVHKLPTVARKEVILPATTLQLLERNVLQFVRQRQALSRLGQSAKKGLLLFGPPGNGKTHTVHYLIGALQAHTTLLISAEQIAQLAEYMVLARLLQPTLVVLEDVDIIARDRTLAGSPCQESLLNMLLNEMDGLHEDAEIIFLLTTNRPEYLEEALASRPGRIDQAIEFPLPDEPGRHKLVQLYARAVKVPEEIVRVIVQRTDGVSAAFIKELMRRSMQFHLAHSDSPTVDLSDVENALQELLASSGRLNRRILGLGQYDTIPRHHAAPQSPLNRQDADHKTQ